MAKMRIINTKFWDDNYIIELDPVEKLLFLYFLTNSLVNICGIYEISLRKIAFDTGIDKEMIVKIIQRFSDDGKIFYIDGWIIIKNFIKNQEIKNKKSNVYQGIINGLKKVPREIWLKINKIKGLTEHILDPIKRLEGTLRDLKELPLLELELELELKSKPKLKEREKTSLSQKPEKSISYLDNIPLEDMEEFKKRFIASDEEIKSKAESLKLYCESKGRVYKNYRSFLLNALKKDFKERKENKYSNL